jgi:hypothetical protein
MLTELTWTHPVHGVVAETLCQVHELSARHQLDEFGIENTAQPTSDERCHRCHAQLRWQQRRAGRATD